MTWSRVCVFILFSHPVLTLNHIFTRFNIFTSPRISDTNWQSSIVGSRNIICLFYINLLTPNDDYSGRIAPLTSKRCILCVYSTHIGTEYFKHGIYSPFFPLKNAVCFIILTYLVPGLFTFYIQGVLKLKNNSGAKRLLLFHFLTSR